MDDCVTLFKSVNAEHEDVYLIYVGETEKSLVLTEDEALAVKAALCVEFGPEFKLPKGQAVHS